MQWLSVWLGGICLSHIWVNLSLPVQSMPRSRLHGDINGNASLLATQIRPKSACPEDIETLAALLVRDLPSYANRVIQQTFAPFRTESRPGTIILASQPDLTPLDLGPEEHKSILPATKAANDTKQVFITTLERQNNLNRSTEIEQFHWIFLAKAESGWYLAFMFSQLSLHRSAKPPAPPRDSSQASIAQAIRLWLRDCRAGAVRGL
ncbi:MAG: hypothetical protein F6K19_01250 [Cyanothece sp. SIO1E1]|nr:hypothetical protein [Cyanothece sp. SIO1E1]